MGRDGESNHVIPGKVVKAATADVGPTEGERKLEGRTTNARKVELCR